MDSGHTWRGGQRQLVLLAIGLRARGWEPLVVGPPGTPLLKALKVAGIATAAREMRAGLGLLAVRGLRRLITTWRPGVVHAHDLRSHTVALGALVARRGRIPLVVTRRLPALPAGVLRRGRRVDRFIAITDAVRQALLARGVEPSRVTLVHPGVGAPAVEVPRDWRAECGWPTATVVVGAVGPLTETRHQRELEALLRHVDAPTRDALGLVLLGGPAAGRGEIGGIRAYRAGFVHDIPRALAGLELILHPGGAEGLGTAVVEGMALRVPTLGFAVGGVGEIVESGRNGLLVPPGDEVAFARALGDLTRDATRRAALGAAGPERAAAFSADQMVDRTVAVYRDLLDEAMVREDRRVVRTSHSP